MLVVTHAFAIKSLVYLYAPDRINDPPKIENTSVTKLHYDDARMTFDAIGDTSYMHETRQSALGSQTPALLSRCLSISLKIFVRAP